MRVIEGKSGINSIVNEECCKHKEEAEKRMTGKNMIKDLSFDNSSSSARLSEDSINQFTKSAKQPPVQYNYVMNN